jgi:hypothetical protein
MVKEIENVDEFIDNHYVDGFYKLISNSIVQAPNMYQRNQTPFNTELKSDLLRTLLSECSHKNWVDIENYFYSELKNCWPGSRNVKGLDQLNASLNAVLNQLEIYLSTIDVKNFIPDYSDIFGSKILKDDIVNSKVKSDELPYYSMALNFNYTGTVEKYLGGIGMGPDNNIDINYIHGQLNHRKNPLIFGFGDELDDDYLKMEHTNNNGFFEHIKSFGYFKTSNYHNLIRFIESEEYQVYTLGHSCGLSDRTLLNMIFEHENCKSIKIYYHGDEHQNDHKRLTQEISRHFKDKVAMRKKIVPLTRSQSMPQVKVK